MALFVLRRLDMDAPIYDANNGFVVRAGTALRARFIAAEHAADEGPETWKDANRSTCEALSDVGNDIIVMADFNAG
ncbi:MAG: hypothetical protein ACR2OV_00295 [Hyphomicrobiaceae bacterium]